MQPFSVRADSDHRRLATRLLEFIKANHGRFEQAGFRWRGDEAAVRSDKLEIPPWLRDSSWKASNADATP